MKVGVGCPLDKHFHMHWGRVANLFGWALYLGPIYIMRVR